MKNHELYTNDLFMVFPQVFHGVQTHENSLVYHGYIILLQRFMVTSLPMKNLPAATFMVIAWTYSPVVKVSWVLNTLVRQSTSLL